ncbi:MAG TPA: hypothetical protein VGG25_25840 [Streptosporangiaceae bacterium]
MSLRYGAFTALAAAAGALITVLAGLGTPPNRAGPQAAAEPE